MVRSNTLQTRMVAALALSLLGYGVLVWLVVQSLPTQLAVLVGGLLVSALVVLVHEADRIAYLLTSAVSIDHDQHPNAYRTLHRLAQQAGIATPALAVIPTDEPNAVTAGRGDPPLDLARSREYTADRAAATLTATPSRWRLHWGRSTGPRRRPTPISVGSVGSRRSPSSRPPRRCCRSRSTRRLPSVSVD